VLRHRRGVRSFGAPAALAGLTFLGAETTRAALAIALSRMVSDGLLTRAQALQIGKGVLRDNALALHGLGPQQESAVGSAAPVER
jgi:hypothetical protein